MYFPFVVEDLVAIRPTMPVNIIDTPLADSAEQFLIDKGTDSLQLFALNFNQVRANIVPFYSYVL
jgi:hypothetical protein